MSPQHRPRWSRLPCKNRGQDVDSGITLRNLIAAIAALFAANTLHAETLETQSFVIGIETKCAEGNVSCDDVTYTSKNKKSGKRIVLRGKTMHTLCKDGVTPCRFLGWEFRNGSTKYRVTEAGELSVLKDDKVLLNEKGQWREAP